MPHFYKNPKLIFALFIGLLVSACDEDYIVDEASSYLNDETTSSFEGLISTPKVEQMIAEGLSAWRKTGNIQNGAACVNCHAPDAFDLAFLDITPDDIQRRALAHVPQEDADKIKGLIEAIRIKYRISETKDRHEFRLMQPGGEVLPGNTPTERDIAFGKTELPKWLPTLVKGEVKSLEDAKKVTQEYAAMDIQEMKIGIPLPLWSNDMFHGNEFGTIDEWMPNFPCLPNSEEFYKVQNTYIKDPTRENLWKMIDAAGNYTDCANTKSVDGESPGRAIERHKYFAVLLGQHTMREQTMSINDFVQKPLAFAYTSPGMDLRRGRDRHSLPNFHIWEVAEIGRKPRPDKGLKSGDFGKNSSKELLEQMGYDEFVLKGTDPAMDKRELQNVLQTSWFWLHTQYDDLRETGYFMLATTRAGYLLHSQFRGSFRTLKAAFGNEVWSNPNTFSPRINGMRDLETYIQNEEQKAIFRKIQINMSWTLLYLAKDWVDHGKKPINNDGFRHLGMVTNYLKDSHPDGQKALSMFYDICNTSKALPDSDVKLTCDEILDNPHAWGPGKLIGTHHNGD